MSPPSVTRWPPQAVWNESTTTTRQTSAGPKAAASAMRTLPRGERADRAEQRHGQQEAEQVGDELHAGTITLRASSARDRLAGRSGRTAERRA